MVFFLYYALQPIEYMHFLLHCPPEFNLIQLPVPSQEESQKGGGPIAHLSRRLSQLFSPLRQNSTPTLSAQQDVPRFECVCVCVCVWVYSVFGFGCVWVGVQCIWVKVWVCMGGCTVYGCGCGCGCGFGCGFGFGCIWVSVQCMGVGVRLGLGLGLGLGVYG